MKEKISPVVKIGSRLAILTLAASACTSDVGETPVFPSAPTLQPVPTEVSGATEPAEVTQTPLAISGENYPTSPSELILEAGGPDNAQNRLLELGAGADLEKMRGLYIAELNRIGIDQTNVNWVVRINELARNPSWTLMVQDASSGKFYFPRITEGPEKGLLVRSGNLASYLSRDFGDDFFELVTLENPEGLPGAEQRLVPDESGWWIAGVFSQDGNLLSWFDAENDKWQYMPESGVVLETLPTTCFDEEAQGRVVDEFLQSTGYENMQDAMKAFRESGQFEKNLYWGGFQSDPSWLHELTARPIGGFSVSLSQQPGYETGDSAACLLTTSPYYPDMPIPVIVGIEKDGKWYQTIKLYTSNTTPWENVDNKELSSRLEAESWMNSEELRKAAIWLYIAVRYYNPELITWSKDREAVMPLLKNPNGYIMRYTKDPSILIQLGGKQLYWQAGFTGSNSFNLKPGDAWGEQIEMNTVVSDLKRNGGVDVGLFTTDVYTYKILDQ